MSGASGSSQRGTTPGFSWARLRQVMWRDRVRVVEFTIALFFFMFRGVFLIQEGFNNPNVSFFLREVNLNETWLGIFCIAQACAQIYGSATERRLLRAAIAGIGVAVGVAVQVTFVAATAQWQSGGVVWLSVILVQCYIVLRNFLATDDDPD